MGSALARPPPVIPSLLIVPGFVFPELDYWCHERLGVDTWLTFLHGSATQSGSGRVVNRPARHSRAGSV